MRILVIPSWYPGGQDKLIGIYHKEFTEALNKNGINADMLYVDVQPMSNPFKFLFSAKSVLEEESNYKVFKRKILNFSKFGESVQMKHYIKGMDKALTNYIKTVGKPDVLHAQVMIPAGYAACVLGEKYGIHVVVSEHYSKFEDFFTKDEYKNYKDFVMDHSYYTTVSEWMKTKVLKYAKFCDALPNLVDVNNFKNDKTRELDGKLKLLTIGAFRKGKGIETAILAIKSLIDEGIEVEYNIVGEGFFLNEYKKIVEQHDLLDVVHFLGRKNKSEIAEIMKDNHILLIASEIETFAIPGIEALASGMPVVSTECKGPEEFIDKKCGDLCAINDAEDMADSIKYVYEEYEKFDRKHMNVIADAYSEEAVCKKAKEIYEKVLKR